MKKITLYHNPRCSKSRNAKALLEEHGADLSIVEYLKTPPGVEELKNLASLLGMPVREMMRTNESPYRELQLDKTTRDEDLLAAIAEHPILLQRPIAVAGKRAIIGRPPENVLELL
jgi:arsenate reductase (glutaredoxin)